MRAVVVEIPLKPYSSGAKAIVNKGKYNKVIRLSSRWYLHQPNGDSYQSYARAEVWKNNKRKRYYLHRVVMDAMPNQTVDHVNGNGLDCTNKNLRFCTDSQNAANRRDLLPKHNTSGYLGVNYHKSRGKWRAIISYQKKFIHIGYFDDPKEAAKAYDKKTTELFGQYATLNMVK